MNAALHVAFVPSTAHTARIRVRVRVRVSTRPCAPIPTHHQHARRPTPSSSCSSCSGRTTVRANPNADLDPGTERRRKSIAVFVSGGGSNFRAIHADILDGSINGDVAVVVTNAPGCAAAVYAREHGIPVAVYPPGKHTETTVCGSPRALVDELESHGVDLVVLAGYMKLIPVEVVKAYEKRMLNIHPGLLPGPFGGHGMYGMNVHAAVVRSGSRVSGCTVHFVNDKFDEGPILGQAVVPVFVDDTPERVAARVLKQEHELFPRCVRAYCDDRIGWREDGVPYIVGVN